jgi:hypothetical protein
MSLPRACWLAAALVLCTLAAERPARASTDVSDSERHRHDGFMFRLVANAGYGSTLAEDNLVSGPESRARLQFRGYSLSGSMALGGRVAENLVLHGNAFVTSGNRVLNRGLGVGLTYYFMPANVYASASVAVAGIAVQQEGMSVPLESGMPGPAGELLVGREWWVGDNWGIGIAAQVLYTNAGGKYFDRWSAWHAGIGGSLTFQ